MDRQPPVPPEGAFAAYQEHLRRGHQALGRGDAKGALEAYRAAADVAGERALPHVLIGRALLALNRPAEALPAIETALQRDPADAAALAAKVDALLRLNRHADADAARQQLDAAGAGRESERDGLAGLPRAEVLAAAGESAWLDGRHETAIGEWLNAARLHAGDGHLDAALDVCQRALIADAGSIQVHLEMSRLYLAAGHDQHATDRLLLLGRLIELEPDDAVRAQVLELAAQRAAAEPRLAELLARLDEPAAG